MKISDDTAITVLHALARVCADSAAGYATVERDVIDPDLAKLFAHFRHDRLKMLGEIEHRLACLRGAADAKPTLGGAVHRAWIDYRSHSAENPTEALLVEIERGEDLAVDAYRQALKERDVDAATLQLVQRHYESVQAAHDRIRQLRNRAGATHA